MEVLDLSEKLNLEIHPLDVERWDDLVKLFGKTGADGGCWCMYWRLSQKEYSAGDRNRNKRLLKSLVEEGQSVGLIAYHGETPVGWCGLGPRESFKRLERSRYLKRVDDKPVWSIVCFFINSKYRRKGVASALIKAAIEYATDQGAPTLESYPILEWGPNVTSTSAYTGTVEMYQKAGFRKVKVTKARSGGQPRVIMRSDLKS
jgi:GNAT superfamily N-acetyltransferase